jgi:UDP-glucose 6-dehydrogenase
MNIVNIAAIGAGNVALVSANIFANFRHEATFGDVDHTRSSSFSSGVMPLFGQEAYSLGGRHLKSNRRPRASDSNNRLQQAELVLIAMAPPERRGDIHTNLSFACVAALPIAKIASRDVKASTKSPAPVEAEDAVETTMNSIRPGVPRTMCPILGF